MCKRYEAVRPASGRGRAASQQPAMPGLLPLSGSESPHMEKDIVNIGKSVVIKASLSSEDLTIEGTSKDDSTARPRADDGPNGRIKAQCSPSVVLGEVTGNVT